MGCLLVTSDTHLRTKINTLLPNPCKTISRIGDLLNSQRVLLQQMTCIIVDDKVADGSQGEIIYRLIEQKISTPVLQLIRTSQREPLANTPISYGNIILVQKPFSDLEFLQAMQLCIRKQDVIIQDTVHEKQIDYCSSQLVGSCESMQDLRKRIKALGDETCSVHISGETGTGKEIVAKLLHDSGTSKGAFIPENCSLLDGPLAEEILFGHKKGSFTDAHENRTGLVMAANDGSLFLDEVENLPLSTQAKLLRLLEGGHFRPIGATQPEFSTFRLLSAANIPLPQLVQEHKVRKDFFYRISDVVLQIPPLRERMGDIEELCRHYLNSNKDNRELDKESLDRLIAYSWPGNVRQLFSVLKRGQIRSKDEPSIKIIDEDLEYGS